MTTDANKAKNRLSSKKPIKLRHALGMSRRFSTSDRLAVISATDTLGNRVLLQIRYVVDKLVGCLNLPSEKDKTASKRPVAVEIWKITENEFK